MLLRPRPRRLPLPQASLPQSSLQRSHYATVSATTVPAPSHDQMAPSPVVIQRYPSTQPPSHKSPLMRKAQLHRQYSSLLSSTPLMLVFQHNNVRASEWAGIRRELALALKKATAAAVPQPGQEGPAIPSVGSDAADNIKLQVIQSGIFAAALRVVEFFDPANTSTNTDGIHATAQQNTEPTHRLSHAAHLATLASSTTTTSKKKAKASQYQKRDTPLHALLSGPLAVVAFPDVDPAHLAITLKILAPTPGAASAFPAPRRRDSPGYYEAPVQNGLQKLMLLGARVEGRTMDQEGVRWVGGLETLEQMQARLVGLLMGMGMGVTGVLEGAGRSLWIGLESRRLQMEEESKPPATEGGDAKPAA